MTGPPRFSERWPCRSPACAGTNVPGSGPIEFLFEMKRAMERHERGEARVIPIILRPCDWRSAPFGKLQALPKDGRPVTQRSSRDKAFLDVASG